jgi:hypothetical protein
VGLVVPAIEQRLRQVREDLGLDVARPAVRTRASLKSAMAKPPRSRDHPRDFIGASRKVSSIGISQSLRVFAGYHAGGRASHFRGSAILYLIAHLQPQRTPPLFE